MSGTFTNSRVLPLKIPWRSSYRSRNLTSEPPAYLHPMNWGSWQHGAWPYVHVPVQTTTSYRTGEQDSGATTDSEEEILNAKSYAERFSAMRKERRGRTSGRQGDTGHPFFTAKQEIILSPTMVNLHRRTRYDNAAVDYQGPLVPDYRFCGMPYRQAFLTRNGFNSSYYGPRAIAATTPTNPASSLAVSLTELKREGIARLPFINPRTSNYRWEKITDERTTRYVRKHDQKFIDSSNPGGEYLNVEFGWKPLIAATAETMVAVSESAKILRQYQRDSGRMVRRSWSFPEERIHEVAADRAAGYTCLVDPYQNGQFGNFFYTPGSQNWTWSESRTITRNVWFKGAYSYYLQGDNSHLNKLFEFEQKANRLLGTRITPGVVWQVTPWSWLVDWNANIGDNIANADALSSDGLVIRYGYLMCQTQYDHTVTVRGARDYFGAALPEISITWRETTKERVKAEPYGFGTNPQSYTGRQWAILAALGMTKAPNSLK